MSERLKMGKKCPRQRQLHRQHQICGRKNESISDVIFSSSMMFFFSGSQSFVSSHKISFLTLHNSIHSSHCCTTCQSSGERKCCAFSSHPPLHSPQHNAASSFTELSIKCNLMIVFGCNFELSSWVCAFWIHHRIFKTTWSVLMSVNMTSISMFFSLSTVYCVFEKFRDTQSDLEIGLRRATIGVVSSSCSHIGSCCISISIFNETDINFQFSSSSLLNYVSETLDNLQ